MSLASIIPFWFQPNASTKIWFQKNIQQKQELDRWITNEYYPLLNDVEQMSFLDLLTTYTTDEFISIIICLDQFSRHIYRGSETNRGIIYKNTQKSLHIANYLCYSKKIDTIDIRYIPFILMPYKHLGIVTYFKHIHSILEKQGMLDSLFYKDCLTKYLVNNKHLLDSLPNQYSVGDLRDVCEFYPTQDKSIIQIDNVLEKRTLYKIVDRFIKKLQTNSLTISLSGGVDSMVLTYILSIICKKRNIDFQAFHIHYGNREVADIEQQVIYDFCKQLGIPIYIHKIQYLKRCDSERSYYEKTTRKIRFNLYKYVGGNIVLGHIKDDLVENIWTNFTKGEHIFKLHKMDEISYIEDVWILRPFINVEKQDILEFAHRYNIPYLKNTTPVWSNRGKMRMDFLPSIEKQFGKGVGDTILDVSRHLESYWDILERKLFNPFYESIRYIGMGIVVYIGEYMDMNIHFWQTIFKKVYHQMDLNIPSISSVKNFVERVKHNKLGLINMKSSTYTYIDLNGHLYILKRVTLGQLLNKDVSKIGTDDWKRIKPFI